MQPWTDLLRPGNSSRGKHRPAHRMMGPGASVAACLRAVRESMGQDVGTTLQGRRKLAGKILQDKHAPQSGERAEEPPRTASRAEWSPPRTGAPEQTVVTPRREPRSRRWAPPCGRGKLTARKEGRGFLDTWQGWTAAHSRWASACHRNQDLCSRQGAEF